MRMLVSRFFSPSVFLFAVLFLLPLQTRWIILPGTLNNLYWEYGTISLYGTDILIILFIASVFLRRKPLATSHLPLGQRIRSLVARNKWLVALTVWSFLSILWSANHLIAFYQSLKLLEGILLFGAIRIFIHRHPESDRGISVVGSQITHYKLLTSFTAGAFFQASFAIWQFLTQTVIANKWLGVAFHDPGQSGAAVVETALRRWLRAYGTLPHPNILGEFLVIGLIFYVLWLLIGSPQLKQRALNAETTAKFLFWSLVVSLGLWIPYIVLVSGLFFTFSRAAWLAFFVCLALLLFLSLRPAKRSLPSRDLPQGDNPDSTRHPELATAAGGAPLEAVVEGSRTLAKALAIAVVVFAILGTVFSDPVGARITARGRLETKSTTERIAGYTRAWSFIQQHPVLGTGIGQSSLAVSPELEKNIPAETRARSLEAATPIHNTPLLVFVELGLVGGLLYLAFWSSLIRSALKNVIPSRLARRSLGEVGAEGSRSPAAVALLALVLLTLFDHSFWTLHPGQMLFWGVAGLASISEVHSNSE